MKSLQWASYKGTGGKWGALQFTQQVPHYYKDKEKDFTGSKAFDNSGKLLDGWAIREGAVFIEAAQTVGPNKYDWEKKIIFALSVTDIGKVLLFLSTGNDSTLMHDPGAKSDRQGQIKKYLNLTSPKGILDGGALVSLSMTSGDETSKYTIPLSPDECIILKTLLTTAVSRSVNW